MKFGLNKNAVRLLTGLIMGTIALWCLTTGGLAILVLVSIFVVEASKEFVKILQNKGFYPSLKVILLADALFAALAYFERFDLVAVAFSACSIMAFMWILFRGKQPYIANTATTILGFVYCGWFPLHIIFLRGLGAGYLLMMFLCIVLTDSGCYYIGKNFGKHKLAPIISPNKTIEGSIGGAIWAITGAMIIGYFLNLTWYQSLIAGILITVFAQIGDLSESLIKRDAGVKDSSNILPGHGGFLDRTDSFIFTIPVIYYYFSYFVVSNQISIDFIQFIKGIF